MEAAPDLEAALAVLRAAGSRVHTASDDELLANGATIEAVGRLVDAHRLAFAAEAERRNVSSGGGVPLAFRQGARDAIDLVAHVARIDRLTAKKRVGLGSAIAPRVGRRGALQPGRFDVLDDAARAGEVGVDSARVIVETILHMQRRVSPGDLADAIVMLTDVARVEETIIVRDRADTIAAFLDADGADPDAQRQHVKRSLKLGRTNSDGMTPARLLLTPEGLALMQALLQSRRRSIPLVRTEAGGSETNDHVDPEWRGGIAPEGDEQRSRAQQDYDTALDALEAAMRAEQSAAVTHEVVVHVSAADLEARRGRGWIAGVMAGLSIPTIERIACSAGMRLLVTNDDGEALFLSQTKRVFTPAQKKVLIAKAGGRCEFPGCTTPAPFLQAHHVEWFQRDGGRTDITNGVMLCSHHHHLIHSKVGRIEIRRWRNDLWFVPKRWREDPLPEHRRQPGPMVDPRTADRTTKARDPNPWEP